MYHNISKNIFLKDSEEPKIEVYKKKHNLNAAMYAARDRKSVV